MKSTLNIATICMRSLSNKELNVDKAVDDIRRAKSQGADWVLLPEVFAYQGPFQKHYEMAESDGSELLLLLQNLCKELGIVLFAGSIGEIPINRSLSSKGVSRVYNTLWVIGREGDVLGKYRKTHLFNLLDSEGRPQYCESDGFIPGDDVKVIQVDGFWVGLSICYDLRFSELYHKMQQLSEQPLDIVVVPSAFTKKTGQAHWEVLLRARAVEFQCYVVAANQVGEHSPGKENFGHSMIVDPWGDILDNTGPSEGIAMGQVSRSYIEKVRSQLPVLSNRRPELYE